MPRFGVFVYLGVCDARLRTGTLVCPGASVLCAWQFVRARSIHPRACVQHLDIVLDNDHSPLLQNVEFVSHLALRVKNWAGDAHLAATHDARPPLPTPSFSHFALCTHLCVCARPSRRKISTLFNDEFLVAKRLLLQKLRKHGARAQTRGCANEYGGTGGPSGISAW
jgi:hypothetical protein